MRRFLLCLLATVVLAQAQNALPIVLDGRKLGAVEARFLDGEFRLPLLALAQSLGLRVSLNKHSGTAVMQGREFPIAIWNETAYLAQSQVYPLLGIEVSLRPDCVELATPGYERSSQPTWRAGEEVGALEVRHFEPALQSNGLVVKTRVAPARRFSRATGRVRVLLRSADGAPYASFVSPVHSLSEDQEAELVVGTWLSEGVSVNSDRSLSVKDYEFRGMPPTTRLLTVEATAEP